MMNENKIDKKEIIKMAEAIPQFVYWGTTCCDLGSNSDPYEFTTKKAIAKVLVEAGYGDVRQVAKEILDIVADKVSNAHIPMKQYDWFKELASKYGVEISND